MPFQPARLLSGHGQLRQMTQLLMLAPLPARPGSWLFGRLERADLLRGHISPDKRFESRSIILNVGNERDGSLNISPPKKAAHDSIPVTAVAQVIELLRQRPQRRSTEFLFVETAVAPPTPPIS